MPDAVTLTLPLNYNKIIMISRDFNYDLLKHQINSLIIESLNIMYTNFLQPSILEPTQIVVYNIPSLGDSSFINTFGKDVSSGNLADKISA